MESLTIVEQDQDGSLFTTSEAIAEGAGIEHRAVLQAIGKYTADLEEFGQVAFEMRPGYNNAQVRIAKLNEQQASLLLTYSRNTEQVRTFKIAMVKEFYRMAKELASPSRELSLEEMTLQVIEGQRQRIAELEPKADLADRFLSAEGDYDARDAGQILSRDHGITTLGQKKVFRWLRDHRWIGQHNRPYQAHVDAGRIRLKPSTFKFKRTNGAEQLAAPQVRITPKGIADMAATIRRESLEIAA